MALQNDLKMVIIHKCRVDVAELVDAHGWGPCGLNRAGSSPVIHTIFLAKIAESRRGGIGRRAGFKIPW